MKDQKEASGEILSLLPKRKVDAKYFQALGEFIDAYAALEQAMAFFSEYLLGITRTEAKVILFPGRMDSTIKILKKTIAVKKLKGKRIEYLEKAFVHIGFLESARNAIVHLSPSGTRRDGSRVITNRPLAHSTAAVKRYVTSSKILETMTHDAFLINMSLLIFPGFFEDDTPDKLDLLLKKIMLAHLRRGTLPAWRYKPQKQASHRDRRHAHKPKPKGQR